VTRSVSAPGGAPAFLHRQLGQGPEEGELVRGDLAIPVQDALDLVHRAGGTTGPELEQEREPAHARPTEGIVIVPAADQLEAQALEQQLQEFWLVGHEEPTVCVPVALTDVVARGGQRREQPAVR
jgi:hypothetical protein